MLHVLICICFRRISGSLEGSQHCGASRHWIGSSHFT